MNTINIAWPLGQKKLMFDWWSILKEDQYPFIKIIKKKIKKKRDQYPENIPT